jgi:hypothetical protein
MDAGISTAANIAWLKQQDYRYLVVSRERGRQFDPVRVSSTRVVTPKRDPDQAVETLTASKRDDPLAARAERGRAEVRLYCHSTGRETKEIAITARFVTRFKTGLTALAAGSSKPRGQKKVSAIQQRIGRLKEKSRGIGQHYEIVVTADGAGKNTATIAWTAFRVLGYRQQNADWAKTPVEGSMLTHPGVYCLRSSETTWDADKLWHTYTRLTDLETVFRGLKSELGVCSAFRWRPSVPLACQRIGTRGQPKVTETLGPPVFHHTEDRSEAHLFITVLAY